MTSEPGRSTILVVDDEDYIRAVLRLLLEQQGYTVLLAADGLAAVEVFTAHAAEVSAVLLDLTPRQILRVAGAALAGT